MWEACRHSRRNTITFRVDPSDAAAATHEGLRSALQHPVLVERHTIGSFFTDHLQLVNLQIINFFSSRTVAETCLMSFPLMSYPLKAMYLRGRSSLRTSPRKSIQKSTLFIILYGETQIIPHSTRGNCIFRRLETNTPRSPQTLSNLLHDVAALFVPKSHSCTE